MKLQLILVAIVAVLAGMMTQGPDQIAASSTPSISQLEMALQDTTQQIEDLEKLVAYRQRWTYPGSIDGHLRQHGVDPTGLTHEQKIALHDSIHDISGPTRAGELVPQVQTVKYNVQNCPGGSCPIPRPESALGKVMVSPAKVAVKAVEGTARVASNVVAGTVEKAVDVAQVVLPPYPRIQATTSESYGSVATIYQSSSYSSSPAYRTPVRNILRSQPVRSILRRIFCR